ncbi:MAG: hypothetical protein ACT4N4_08430 [Rhodospirillales bacterium]
MIWIRARGTAPSQDFGLADSRKVLAMEPLNLAYLIGAIAAFAAFAATLAWVSRRS